MKLCWPVKFKVFLLVWGVVFCLGSSFSFFHGSSPAFAQDYALADAVIQYKSGNYTQALYICDQIPYSIQKEMVRGNIYLSAGSAEAAEECFKNVIINNRFYALIDYARLGLIKSYYLGGKYHEVVERGTDFVYANGKSPALPEILLLMGKAYFNIAKYDNALAIFKKILRDPNGYLVEAEAQAYCAACFEKLGCPRSAEKIDKNIEPPSPKETYTPKPGEQLSGAARHFKRGQELFASRAYGPAKTTFQKIARQYPGSKFYDHALLMMGRCDYRLGKVRSAKKLLRQVVKLAGAAAAEAQYYLAIIYAYEDSTERGLKAFQAVVDSFPESDVVDDALYQIGYYQEKNKNTEAALGAYALLLKNYPQSDFKDDATARMGMLQYKAGQYESAYQTFKSGYQSSPQSDLAATCLFWHAKCAQKIGKNNEATSLLQQLSENYDHTYYAYRAREILNAAGEYYSDPPAPADYTVIEPRRLPQKNKEEIAGLTRIWQEAKKRKASPATEEPDSEHAGKFYELLQLGLYQYAALEMMQDPSFRGQRATAAIGVILSHAGDYTSPVRYFEKVTRSAAENQSSQALPPEAWMAAYPLAFWPEVKKQAATYGVDPYLILAIMREESRFDPAVTSRARARGLMQIIKRTGKNIARQLQLENYYTKKLYDPTLNIQMGTYYYSQVFNLFAGNHALALASYNGGPGAVTKWKKKLLDEKGELDIDEFIEHIPYKETKYYVKKVLNTYYEYKRIYGSKG